MSAFHCATLLLLHALALAGVMAVQPQANPRGWQAARRAEQQAAAAAAAAASQVPPPPVPPSQQSPPQALPQGAALQQHTCSFTDLPACPAPLQAAAWARLAACTAVAFLAGVAAGMLLLHVWLRRQRQQHRCGQVAGDSQTGLLSEAASCAAVGGGGQKQQEQRTVTTERLEPAGSEQAGDVALVAAAAAAAAADAAAAAASAADKQGGEPAAAAGAAREAGSCQAAESSGESPGAAPEEAAVAAAVQEIVLQQSSGSGAGSAPAAAAGIPSASAGASELQEQRLPQQEAPPPHSQQAQEARQLPLAAMVGHGAVGGGGAGGGDGGALGTLRADDQADIQAAAQLVLTMCRSMHVDPAQLDRGERLQLIYTMLHAWQAQQARRHTHEVSRRAAAPGGRAGWWAAGRPGCGRLASLGRAGRQLAGSASCWRRRAAPCPPASLTSLCPPHACCMQAGLRGECASWGAARHRGSVGGAAGGQGRLPSVA